MRKILAIIALGFLLVPQLQANDVYIAFTSAGGNTGADCADALVYTYFNSSGNWTASTGTGILIGYDTKVHLCGTFSGTAGAGLLVCPGTFSGISGHPITVIAETGADLTNQRWLPSPLVCTGPNNWMVYDGGTNGTIENTQNGTGLTFNTDSAGMNIVGSNVIIRNWTIKNICNILIADSTGCDFAGAGTFGIGVGNGPAISNVTITNNTITKGGYQGILYAPISGDSNVTISSNTVSGSNWGIDASLNSGTTTGLIITGNDITCTAGGACIWDGTSAHHNGIIMFPQTGATMNGVVVNGNYIHDINGNSTGGIFLDPSGTGNIPNVQLINGVFFTSPGQTGPGNAQIECGAGVSGCIIANNAAVGPTQAEGCITGQNDSIIKNNICSGTASGVYLNTTVGSTVSDYNDFYNLTSPSSVMSYSSGLVNFAFVTAAQGTPNWVTSTGLDTHSITTNPNLTTALVPNIGSPVLLAGTNLTSLGIAGLDVGAPQNFGVGGGCGIGCMPRPSSGNWDIGAYQVSGSTPSIPPAPARVMFTISKEIYEEISRFDPIRLYSLRLHEASSSQSAQPGS